MGEDGEDERAKVRQAAERGRLDHPRGCRQSQLSSEAPNTGHSGAQGAAVCAGAAGSGSELCKCSVILSEFGVCIHTHIQMAESVLLFFETYTRQNFSGPKVF